MERAIDGLNRYAKHFNQDSGEYLNLVGDASQTIPALSGSIKINDFDIGAIANGLEYVSRFMEFLLAQLSIQTGTTPWLDYMGETLYGVSRLPAETDAAYTARIIDYIMVIKCTPNRIRDVLLPYADDVQIIEGIDDGAFADVSFSDNYSNFNRPGEDVVKAAISSGTGGLIFFFRVLLTNPDPTYYQKIIDLIDNYRAAGILYDIIIN